MYFQFINKRRTNTFDLSWWPYGDLFYLLIQSDTIVLFRTVDITEYGGALKDVSLNVLRIFIEIYSVPPQLIPIITYINLVYSTCILQKILIQSKISVIWTALFPPPLSGLFRWLNAFYSTDDVLYIYILLV